MNYPVFVYGTLKRGYGLHDSIVRSHPNGYEFQNEVSTCDLFGLYDLGGYPLLVDQDTAEASLSSVLGHVKGEMYLASQAAIRDMMGVEAGAGYNPVAIGLREHPSAVLAWLHPNPPSNNDRWVQLDQDGVVLEWNHARRNMGINGPRN